MSETKLERAERELSEARARVAALAENLAQIEDEIDLQEMYLGAKLDDALDVASITAATERRIMAEQKLPALRSAAHELRRRMEGAHSTVGLAGQHVSQQRGMVAIAERAPNLLRTLGDLQRELKLVPDRGRYSAAKKALDAVEKATAEAIKQLEAM